MATQPGGPDQDLEERARQVLTKTARGLTGLVVAGVGLAGMVGLALRKVATLATSPAKRKADSAPTGEFRDISGQLFNSDLETYLSLARTKPRMFNHAIRSLISQIDAPEIDDIKGLFSDENYIVTDGILIRLVALFNGFEKEEASPPRREFVPILDVVLEAGFRVAFKSDSTKAKSATFKVKILGIGGTGACVFRRKINTRFGPYDQSCQLQVPVKLAWATRKRRASGEILHILRVIPEAVGNPKLSTVDESQYKRIAVSRDETVAFINKVSREETKVVYVVEKSSRSEFECDVTDLVGASLGSLAITVESTSESAIEMEISYGEQGKSGHLYASGQDAVLFRAGA